MNEESKINEEEKEVQPTFTQSDIKKGFIFTELILPPISIRKKR
jgi:hypothetical protein